MFVNGLAYSIGHGLVDEEEQRVTQEEVERVPLRSLDTGLLEHEFQDSIHMIVAGHHSLLINGESKILKYRPGASPWL